MSTSSSRSYSIVEPHPSVTNNTHYISTGRGGIGNAVRSSSSSASAWGSGSQRTTSRLGSMSSSASSSASSSRKTFTSGRGGAGNVFPSSERAIFSFDEELEQQLRWERDAAPVYHVGRGGAGNVGHANTNGNRMSPPLAGVGGNSAMMMRRRPSEDSALSATSASSHGSESGADQFNRSVKKGWKKITGMGMHHHHHNLQQ